MNNQKEKQNNINPYLLRFKPDYRYSDIKKTEYKLQTTTGGFISTQESVTDKEAYAINFASERGDVASLGASRQGVYSINPGEKYDPQKDFSYLNRPDITLVDLDEYIEAFKAKLENSDEQLKNQLTEELKTLQDKRDNLINQMDNSKTDTKE